jgi:hypothetical protein
MFYENHGRICVKERIEVGDGDGDEGDDACVLLRAVY